MKSRCSKFPPYRHVVPFDSVERSRLSGSAICMVEDRARSPHAVVELEAVGGDTLDNGLAQGRC
jgi:hypothetical protein